MPVAATPGSVWMSDLPLEGVTTLFVDYFDTMVRRTVSPEDVKRLASGRLARRLGAEVPADLPYRCRAELERWTAERAVARGQDPDVRVDEAFLALWSGMLRRHLGGRIADWTDETFMERALEAELEVELQVQRVDAEVAVRVRAAREAGLAVHLVSDFYLPARHVRQMLHHHRLEDLFDTVQISCDHGRTKASGRLFPRICGQLGVEARHVLMLGDNRHSDVERAREAGLAAVWIDRTREAGRWGRTPDLAELLAPLPPASSPFRELAHVLLFFVVRLDEALQREGAREALFLSREGWLLSRLFAIWQDAQQRHGPSRIASRYLHVSRRSTLLAACGPLDAEHFPTLFRQYREMSAVQFLLNLGCTHEQARALLAGLDLDPDRVEADFPTSPAMACLQRAPAVRSWYEAARQEARTLLRELVGYPEASEGSHAIHLVDVGWKGTIQDQLMRAMPAETTCHGHYLGLTALGETSPRSRKSGLVFHLEPEVSPAAPVFTDNLPLFEMLLGAPHGSVQGYARAGDGSVRPILEDLPSELELYRRVVGPVQEQILRDVEHLAARWARYPGSLDVLMPGVARQFARMALLPTEAERALFQGLHHYENFGRFDTSTFAGGASVFKGLWRLVTQRRRFLRGGWWPVLTLHQHGLGLLARPYAWWRLARTPGLRQRP